MFQPTLTMHTIKTSSYLNGPSLFHRHLLLRESPRYPVSMQPRLIPGLIISLRPRTVIGLQLPVLAAHTASSKLRNSHRLAKDSVLDTDRWHLKKNSATLQAKTKRAHLPLGYPRRNVTGIYVTADVLGPCNPLPLIALNNQTSPRDKGGLFHICCARCVLQVPSAPGKTSRLAWERACLNHPWQMRSGNCGSEGMHSTAPCNGRNSRR